MISLILKDLKISHLFWAPAAFSFFAFELMAFEIPWGYIFAGVAVTFASFCLLLMLDDRYKTDPLFAALPVSRRAIVRARYFIWGLISAAGTILFLASTSLIRGILKSRADHLLPWLSVPGAWIFFLTAFSLGLLFLPFYFDFGLGKGLLGWVVFVLGVMILVSALLPVVVGSTAQSGVGRGADFFAARAGAVLSLFQAAFRAMSHSAVILGSAAAAVVLTFVSVRLSIAFYVRRDL